jgi:transposase
MVVTQQEKERKERGRQIAETSIIRKAKKGGWDVPSQSGAGKYNVSLRGFDPVCTCIDFEMRKCKCKHIFAVELTLTQEITNEGMMTTTKTMRMTYAQDWQAYDKAQTNEKIMFMKLLKDLCSSIEQPVYKFGRPTLPLSDMIFGVVFKVYSTFSLRRFTSDMKIAQKMLVIDKVPCYASLGHFMQQESLTPILKDLITLSATPLREVETHFSPDSSGFNTSQFARYFDYKHGKQSKYRKWLKAHIICGVKTNIITHVEVTEGRASDCVQLPTLIEETAKLFNIKEVSADKAYLSRNNLQLIYEKGAIPFIPFKKNSVVKQKGHPAWKKAYHYFLYHNEEFMEHYHNRSNVETCFHQLKMKFKPNLRSKSKIAQINELYCKILCQNICTVIQEMQELGVKGEFILEDRK